MLFNREAGTDGWPSFTQSLTHEPDQRNAASQAAIAPARPFCRLRCGHGLTADVSQWSQLCDQPGR
jgi:hypothetical protein